MGRDKGQKGSRSRKGTDGREHEKRARAERKKDD